jgi:hypothetical protein
LPLLLLASLLFLSSTRDVFLLCLYFKYFFDFVLDQIIPIIIFFTAVLRYFKIWLLVQYSSVNMNTPAVEELLSVLATLPK